MESEDRICCLSNQSFKELCIRQTLKSRFRAWLREPSSSQLTCHVCRPPEAGVSLQQQAAPGVGSRDGPAPTAPQIPAHCAAQACPTFPSTSGSLCGDNTPVLWCAASTLLTCNHCKQQNQLLPPSDTHVWLRAQRVKGCGVPTTFPAYCAQPAEYPALQQSAVCFFD